MGNSSSVPKPQSCESSSSIGESACPIKAAPQNTTMTSGCPVKSSSKAESNKTDTEDLSAKSYKNPSVYNVYNQKLDSANNMPKNANQDSSPGQTIPLDKERVKSTIPKGGTDNDTWQYPSPQMFWNALVRKNKEEGAREEDIDSVVAVHNNMNENTWKQVMAWENLRGEVNKPGEEPKLLRFLGKPHDLSPKAYLKSLLGHPKPFDRHDWFVDRGGREVRYVIDYYHDESGVSSDQKPTSMHDTKSIKSIIVEVRPAVDSFQAILDRLFYMPLKRRENHPAVSAYVDVPFFAKSKMIQAETEKKNSINTQWVKIQSQCESLKHALQNCGSEKECSIAAVQLQKCTASVVCPDVVIAFDACVQKKDGNQDNIEHAYSGILKCIEMFEIESRKVLEE
jgi:cytochrome c heme-lyase